MNLTVNDIVAKRFARGVRGYDPKEVDDFLDIIISDYQTSAAKILELEKKISELETQLVSAGSAEAEFSEIILKANRIATDIVNDAKRESEEMKKKAKAESDRILSEIEGKKAQRKKEYDELNEKYNEALEKFREFISSVSKTLEEFAPEKPADATDAKGEPAVAAEKLKGGAVRRIRQEENMDVPEAPALNALPKQEVEPVKKPVVHDTNPVWAQE